MIGVAQGVGGIANGNNFAGRRNNNKKTGGNTERGNNRRPDTEYGAPLRVTRDLDHDDDLKDDVIKASGDKLSFYEWVDLASTNGI